MHWYIAFAAVVLVVGTNMHCQVTPFQAQIQLLQSELQQRSNREADIHALTSQMQLIQAEVQSLRSQAAMASQLQNEVQQLRQLVSELMQRSTTDAPPPSEKSLGKARASYVTSCCPLHDY